MNTLEIQSWSTHSLDENLNELEVPYSEATLIIDGESLYIKGKVSTVSAIIGLIRSNVDKEIHS